MAKARVVEVLSIICSMILCMQMATLCDSSNIKVRRQQVTVYFHELYNVTDFLVVKGPGFQPITTVDASFGTIFVFNDLVTEGPDITSTPLGNITGTFIASTHDYGRSFLTTLLLALSNTAAASNPDLRGLDGTLTMLGIITFSGGVQPQPITGGSGSFQFVTGTHTVVPVDVSTFTQIYRLDLDLYWPPYSS